MDQNDVESLHLKGSDKYLAKTQADTKNLNQLSKVLICSKMIFYGFLSI